MMNIDHILEEFINKEENIVRVEPILHITSTKWNKKKKKRSLLYQEFENKSREATKEERMSVQKYIDSISEPTGESFYEENKKHIDIRV